MSDTDDAAKRWRIGDTVHFDHGDEGVLVGIVNGPPRDLPGVGVYVPVHVWHGNRNIAVHTTNLHPVTKEEA